jgi:hypothetical protein
MPPAEVKLLKVVMSGKMTELDADLYALGHLDMALSASPRM